MSFIALVAALAASPFQAPIQSKPKPVACPMTLEPAVKGTAITDYNGVRFSYCCPGCDEQFMKDPQAALARAVKAKKTVGTFLFDPVSKRPIDAAKATGGSSDYKGVRFFFETADDKAAFDAEPSKYGELPKSEALYCPINKAAVASYAVASGYADYDGTRYYFCCPGCEKPFGDEPAKYAPLAKDHVAKPKATPAPKKESN